MKKYIVQVREVHVQDVDVKASCPDDAIFRVCQGEGDYLDNRLEYSYTLDSETWKVFEEGEQ